MRLTSPAPAEPGPAKGRDAAWFKVSLAGVELLPVEARIVIASVETYLKYARAIGLTASAAAPA